MPDFPTTPKVLKGQAVWRELYFYQKSEVLYQMSVVFCKRFLPAHGDRTVDQIVQAARSGKQNIVEGLADGVTSTEMQMKLLNVARASLQELQEDYRDHLLRSRLPQWDASSARYDAMLGFCREHNRLEEYEPYFDRWSEEEMCNIGITLCRMTDKMLFSYMEKLQTEFVTQGGIKERMHAARTGYRQAELAELASLRQEVTTLRQEVTSLRSENSALHQELASLRSENASLRSELTSLRSRNPR